MRNSMTAVAALSALAIPLSLTALPAAAEVELPPQVSWTAYDVGSSGYNQSVAIAGAISNLYGSDIRIVPGRNDVARQVPLRDGRVDFSSTGLGAAYFAQEGMFEFAAPDWGPQAVRLMVSSNADTALSVAVAGDVGIETVEDIRGKRIAYIIGSPSLNENLASILHFGDVSMDEVEVVEFSGFTAAWEGLINNQTDAIFAITTSGSAYQLEASPRGIHWPPLPHDDAEGWERLASVAPFFIPTEATEGAGISAANPFIGGTYPFPILLAYEDQDTDLTYNMTKAVIEAYPEYEGSAPGINGWALERQTLDWVVPYHDGAIRYFEEAGVWSEELQAHNDNLIERQEVLIEAWESVRDEGISDEEAFTARWLEVRAEALTEAGFNPVWQ